MDGFRKHLITALAELIFRYRIIILICYEYEITPQIGVSGCRLYYFLGQFRKLNMVRYVFRCTPPPPAKNIVDVQKRFLHSIANQKLTSHFCQFSSSTGN